jgi:hypothetical protein
MRRNCFRTRRRSGTVRLYCPRGVRARMWPFRVLRTARLLPATMALLAWDGVQVSLSFVVLVFNIFFLELMTQHVFQIFDLLGSCDASEPLPHAETVGDCSAALPSGGSCTNVAFSGAAVCTSTTCNDGVISLGWCPGISWLCYVMPSFST